MDKNSPAEQSQNIIPECLDCGACCHSINSALVELLGVDQVAIPDKYIEFDDTGGAHMRMISVSVTEGLVCCAFGENNACGIYERRPFLCREFERGSPECLAAFSDQKKPVHHRQH